MMDFRYRDPYEYQKLQMRQPNATTKLPNCKLKPFEFRPAFVVPFAQLVNCNFGISYQFRMDSSSNNPPNNLTCTSPLGSIELYWTPPNDPCHSNVILCAYKELEPFLSHPDHRKILEMPGIDVELRPNTVFPKMVENHYDLRIVESLLIQSR